MSGCCRPRSSGSTSRRCAPAPPWRSRRCWRKRTAAEVPAALGAALNVAAAAGGQEHRGADGLRRPARALLALVHAALGRKPRQGRQGHDADRRARAGRPAFAVAAVHRRAARQAVHRRSRSTPKGRARASMRTLAKRAGEPDLGGKTIGDLVAAQGRATAETLAKNGCPVRTMHLAPLDEDEPRRADDAFHAGDDHRGASHRRRCVRPAGGGRGQGAGEAVSGREVERHSGRAHAAAES